MTALRDRYRDLKPTPEYDRLLQEHGGIGGRDSRRGAPAESSVEKMTRQQAENERLLASLKKSLGASSNLQEHSVDGSVVKLRERVEQDTKMRVDGNMIYGARVLGMDSKNGRRYSDPAMQEALPLYRGCKIFVDHDEDGKPVRPMSALIGEIQNPRRDGDCIRGDMWVNPKHPLAEAVLEFARSKPHLFGLSHNAEGTTRREGGKLIVESVKAVHSVDIVTTPATSASLFESSDADLHSGEPLVPDAAAAVAKRWNARAAAAQEKVDQHATLSAEDVFALIRGAIDAAPEGLADTDPHGNDITLVDYDEKLNRIRDIIAIYDRELSAKDELQQSADEIDALRNKKIDAAVGIGESYDSLRRQAGYGSRLTESTDNEPTSEYERLKCRHGITRGVTR